MDPIQKLHKVLVDNGLYTKSLDEFRSRTSDPEAQGKIYAAASSNGLTQMSQEDFTAKFFAEEADTFKKKVPTDSGSSSQTGTLPSQEGKGRKYRLPTQEELAKVSPTDNFVEVDGILTPKYSADIDYTKEDEYFNTMVDLADGEGVKGAVVDAESDAAAVGVMTNREETLKYVNAMKAQGADYVEPNAFAKGYVDTVYTTIADSSTSSEELINPNENYPQYEGVKFEDMSISRLFKEEELSDVFNTQDFRDYLVRAGWASKVDTELEPFGYVDLYRDAEGDTNVEKYKLDILQGYYADKRNNAYRDMKIYEARIRKGNESDEVVEGYNYAAQNVNKYNAQLIDQLSKFDALKERTEVLEVKQRRFRDYFRGDDFDLATEIEYYASNAWNGVSKVLTGTVGSLLDLTGDAVSLVGEDYNFFHRTADDTDVIHDYISVDMPSLQKGVLSYKQVEFAGDKYQVDGAEVFKDGIRVLESELSPEDRAEIIKKSKMSQEVSTDFSGRAITTGSIDMIGQLYLMVRTAKALPVKNWTAAAGFAGVLQTHHDTYTDVRKTLEAAVQSGELNVPQEDIQDLARLNTYLNDMVVFAASAFSPNKKLAGIQKDDMITFVKDLYAKEQGNLATRKISQFLGASLKESLKEVGQEEFEYVMQKQINGMTNLMVDKDILADIVKPSEMLETALVTFLGTGAATSGRTMGSLTSNMDTYGLKQTLATADSQKMQTVINKAITEGEIDAEFGKKLAEEVFDIKKYDHLIPDNVENAKREDILPLIKQKEALQQEMKDKDSAFAESYKTQIEAIDGKINEVTQRKESKELPQEEEREVPSQPSVEAEAYKESLSLQEIGSLEDYISYLSTIFPKSVVSKALYHGGKNKGVDKFDAEKGVSGKRIHFTENKEIANKYFEGIEGQLYRVKINLENPSNPDEYRKQFGFNTDISADGILPEYLVGNDGFIGKGATSEGGLEYVVLEGDQVLILGSSFDVAGFKDFMKSKSEGITKAEILTLDTKDQTNLQKVSDFLGKIEADLDQFGQENLSMGLAVETAKAVVKTLKAAVDTGVTLEQAIIDAAKKHNVTVPQIKEALGLSRPEQVKADVEPAPNFDPNATNRTIKIPGTKKVIPMPTQIDNMIDYATQKLVDRFFKIRRIQRNIERQKGKVAPSANFNRAEIALHGKASNELNIFEKKVEGIAKKMAKYGLSSDKVSEFLYARHAQERNKHIRENIDKDNEAGSGMTDAEAQLILDSTTGDLRVKLEDIASEIDAIMEGTRVILERSGLMSPQAVQNLRNAYEHYVPLTGFAADEKTGSEYLESTGDLEIRGKDVKRALGRKTKAGDIMSNIIAARQKAIIRGRKNEVMQSLYNLAKDNPNPELWMTFTEDNPDTTRFFDERTEKLSERPVNMEFGNNYVTLRMNGKKHFVKFIDSDMARVINGANIERADVITKTLGKFNRFLSLTLTSLNPEFIISNFARDIQTAVYNQLSESDISNDSLKDKSFVRKTVKTTFPAMKTILKAERSGVDPDTELGKFYKEFKEDGAKTGWFYAMSPETIKSNVDSIIDMYTAPRFSPKRAKKGLRAIMKFTEDINSAVENAVRLAAYVEARKAGVTRGDAGTYAKELTINFNKTGESGAVVNSLFLFFNAAVQGTSRFARAVTRMKKTVREDGSTKYSLNKAQKLAGAVTLFSSLLTMYNMGMSDDDEDGRSFYQKIPDFEKERNLIIMSPDGKDYFKIPLPYGYNIFSNVGTTMAEVAGGDRTAGSGVGFITRGMVGAFSPINIPESDNAFSTMARTASPTILKPIVELAINENHFGGTIYNENLPFGTPKPESHLGRRMTPQAYKNISTFLNEATGGSEYTSGSIDINPDKIHHVFNFAVGGTGRFITNAAESVGAGIEKLQGAPGDIEARKIPFLRKVYGEPSRFSDQADYYDRRDEIAQLKDELLSDYKNKKDDPKYKGVVELSSRLKMADKQLSGFRKLRDRAMKIEDPIERAIKLKDIEEKMDAVIDKFNSHYHRFRGTKKK